MNRRAYLACRPCSWPIWVRISLACVYLAAISRSSSFQRGRRLKLAALNSPTEKKLNSKTIQRIEANLVTSDGRQTSRLIGGTEQLACCVMLILTRNAAHHDDGDDSFSSAPTHKLGIKADEKSELQMRAIGKVQHSLIRLLANNNNNNENINIDSARYSGRGGRFYLLRSPTYNSDHPVGSAFKI